MQCILKHFALFDIFVSRCEPMDAGEKGAPGGCADKLYKARLYNSSTECGGALRAVQCAQYGTDWARQGGASWAELHKSRVRRNVSSAPGGSVSMDTAFINVF